MKAQTRAFYFVLFYLSLVHFISVALYSLRSVRPNG